MSDFASAYRYHRQRGKTASAAIALAREDVAKGTERYDGGRHGYSSGKPFAAYGEDHMRWIENPSAAGLRFVGYADIVAREHGSARSIDHKGWYTDEDHMGETVRGVVFRMAARGGRARFVAGYGDPCNGSADADGPVCLSFSEVYQGEVGGSGSHSFWYDDSLMSAARAADHIAEKMAEREREYRSAWQAGSRWSDLGDEIAAERASVLALLAERRAVRSVDPTAYPAICTTIRAAVEDGLETIRKARKARTRLRAGEGEEGPHGSWVHGYFWTGDPELVDAFNDGAGL